MGDYTFHHTKMSTKMFLRLLLQFALQCDILLSNRFESASSTVQQGGTGGLNAVLRFEETQVS